MIYFLFSVVDNDNCYMDSTYLSVRKALLSKNRLTHIANPELFFPGYHENDVLCKLQNMNTRRKLVSQGLLNPMKGKKILPHISSQEVNFTSAPLSLRKIRVFVVYSIILVGSLFHGFTVAGKKAILICSHAGGPEWGPLDIPGTHPSLYKAVV